MTISNFKVTPTCRYGHGPLTHVTGGKAAKVSRFGWVTAGDITQQFVGALFTCSVCG